MRKIQLGPVTYELHRVYTGSRTIPELVQDDLLRHSGDLPVMPVMVLEAPVQQSDRGSIL